MNQITLQIGSTLRGGTYRIDRVLGQGGFGITYLATDLSLDKNVAIKEFFPRDYCDRNSATSHVTLGTQSTAEFVERLKAKFLKEAKNIAKFDHPNIIKIYAAFEENNTAYYVMEFIKGESLACRVQRDGALSRVEALKYVEKVGKALDYVHSFRMNHLDVKPANIMVRSKDNCPILIDFGLSKQYDASGNQTSTTPVGISHGYAPMEQYNYGGVREFSPTTDEYSLAATLYYLLSGIAPPQATNLIEDDLVFPQCIPMDLVFPITKAMSSARKDRYPTVLHFITAINVTATADATEIVEPQKYVFEQQSPRKHFRFFPSRLPASIWWCAGGGIGVVLVASLIWKPWSRTLSDAIRQDSITVDNVKTTSDDSSKSNGNMEASQVTSMVYHHALGDCSYLGEADMDNRPHGRGVATWKSGDAQKYDGGWVHGKMEGSATYTLRNGDMFEGTFKADKYSKGRYTIQSTGEYFDGTYKNGEPDEGAWYDKNGNIIE